MLLLSLAGFRWSLVMLPKKADISRVRELQGNTKEKAETTYRGKSWGCKMQEDKDGDNKEESQFRKYQL